MHLPTALAAEHSRAQAQRLAAHIGTDQQRLTALLDLMLGDDRWLSQRAARVLSKVAESYPRMLVPHYGRLLQAWQQHSDWHPAVLRNGLRSLVGQPIPEGQQGAWLDLCMRYLQNPQCPAAIRVHAMQIAFDLSRPYPELCQELRQVLEAHLPHSSAGFRSRARSLLRQMEGMERTEG